MSHLAVAMFWLQSGATANDPKNSNSQPEYIDLSIVAMLDILIITPVLTAILYWRSCQTNHHQQGFHQKLGLSIKLVIFALMVVAAVTSSALATLPQRGISGLFEVPEKIVDVALSEAY